MRPATATWPLPSGSPKRISARHARLTCPFTASSLDAPLSEAADAAILADVLGADDHDLEHAIDMDAVHAHLEELPEREQRILALRFYGNLTQTEIGQRLGISQMHVSRALAYLRDKLTSEPETAR
jgi:RNA polymerase sigma-B factor